MLKLRLGLLALATSVVVPAGLTAAQILGPTPAVCSASSAPSILVRVSGLKDRGGKLRVRTFGGSPENYFDKTKALLRVEYAVPDSGPVEVCVPVPAVGVYALDVRHDTNGNGKTDRADGAGASGNPKLSFFDVLFKRKPPAKQVQVSVGQGTTVVPILVRYL
jgi:uncharacterized protein (DUF2141 family)